MKKILARIILGVLWFLEGLLIILMILLTICSLGYVAYKISTELAGMEIIKLGLAIACFVAAPWVVESLADGIEKITDWAKNNK